MADVYLLDTMVASDYANKASNNYAAIRSWLAKLKSDDYVFISTITPGEIRYGLEFGVWGDRARDDFLAEISRTFKLRVVDENVAAVYGRLKAWIYDKYAPRDLRGKVKTKAKVNQIVIGPHRDFVIGENDLWIASTAIAYNMIYVTFDERQTRIFEAAKTLYTYTNILKGIAALRTSP